MRWLVLVAVCVLACSPKRQPTSFVEQAREQHVDCFERFEPYGDQDVLTCAADPVGMLGPVVASPGHLRMVIPWPVPGVPRAAADGDDTFFVVDLTPDGQRFVASGACDDPVAFAWDGRGDFHVICVRIVARSRRELQDLVLRKRGFAEARAALMLEADALPNQDLVVAYPDRGAPIVLYERHGQGWSATRWQKGARAYPIASERPAAVFVQAAAVRAIVDDRIVELGSQGPIDRGRGVTGGAAASDACDGLVGRGDGLELANGHGRFRVDGARAVPGLQHLAPKGRCDADASTCGASGCVAVVVEGLDRVRINRAR